MLEQKISGILAKFGVLEVGSKCVFLFISFVERTVTLWIF